MSGGVGLCSSQRSRWMSIHSSMIGSCDRLIWRFRRTDSAFCKAFSSELAIAPDGTRLSTATRRLVADPREQHDEVAWPLAMVELRHEDLVDAELHATGRAG